MPFCLTHNLDHISSREMPRDQNHKIVQISDMDTRYIKSVSNLARLYIIFFLIPSPIRQTFPCFSFRQGSRGISHDLLQRFSGH